MKKFPDWLSLIGSVIMIMISSILVKCPHIDQGILYCIFLAQVFFCGLGFNAVFVILESRTNPKLLAVSYELNLCVASGSTMIIPVLAKFPDPIPTIWFVLCGTVVIFVVIKIGSRK